MLTVEHTTRTSLVHCPERESEKCVTLGLSRYGDEVHVSMYMDGQRLYAPVPYTELLDAVATMANDYQAALAHATA